METRLIILLAAGGALLSIFACAARSLPAQAVAPSERAGDARPKPDNYDQWREALDAEAATAAEMLTTLPDFEVELLRSARPDEGSWISMAFDPEGRLTISREDQGLLRLIVPDIPIDPRFDVPHPPEPFDVEYLDDDFSDEAGEAGGDDANYDAEDETGTPDDEAAAQEYPEADPEKNSEEIPEENIEPYDPFFLRSVEDSLKECRGLLYAYDALYANANNSKGLYRLRDNDNDGHFEDVELLRATPGGVGHGRNDLALGPDGLIYSMHGNDVQLPKDYHLGESPYRNYQVDALLPCEWNKFLFNAGATVPAGHLVRTDAEGERWEVVAGGMRNPYGIAFNPDGEAFTYDADMEWDAGAPWYRPTRVHHVVSGADYGWRQGTGKWPPWMPESLPANVDVGLGSPTAVEFGTDSNFPQKYRDALFINEWAYGRIIAVHLESKGASYTGELETFVEGRPLNVTDLTFGPDGHMYFITGGRKTQSGLYRVKYVGSDADELARPLGQRAAADVRSKTAEDYASGDIKPSSNSGGSPHGEGDSEDLPPDEVARAERRQLEAFHGKMDGRAVEAAWNYLDHDDIWLRHAARVAVEAQPADTWAKRALAEERTTAGLTALMALARVGDAKWQKPLLSRLAEFKLKALSPADRLIALRTYQLCFIRMGHPDAETAKRVAEIIARQYPSYKTPRDDARADRLSCELLVYLKLPDVIEKTLALLESDRSDTEKLHYLFCLRHVKDGWSLEQRKTLFHWLRKARGFAGAHYVPRFVHYIEQDCLAHLTDAEREEVLPILNAKVDEPAIDLGADRDVVKDWKLIDFVFSLDKVGQNRDFERGKRMFHVARCSACHRVGEQGNAFGPDLTEVAKRFGRRDLLVSMLSPSKVIADKYQAMRFEMADGRVVTGLVIGEDDTHLQVSADPLRPQMLTTLAKDEIEAESKSPVSTMPEDLLNTLEMDEVLDLLAYLEAGGNPQSEHFQ